MFSFLWDKINLKPKDNFEQNKKMIELARESDVRVVPTTTPGVLTLRRRERQS